MRLRRVPVPSRRWPVDAFSGRAAVTLLLRALLVRDRVHDGVGLVVAASHADGAYLADRATGDLLVLLHDGRRRGLDDLRDRSLRRRRIGIGGLFFFEPGKGYDEQSRRLKGE